MDLKDTKVLVGLGAVVAIGSYLVGYSRGRQAERLRGQALLAFKYLLCYMSFCWSDGP